MFTVWHETDIFQTKKFNSIWDFDNKFQILDSQISDCKDGLIWSYLGKKRSFNGQICLE